MPRAGRFPRNPSFPLAIRVIAPGGFNATGALATQANGGFARVKGLELNYSQQLSFLPGCGSGFGIFANYSKIKTNGN